MWYERKPAPEEQLRARKILVDRQAEWSHLEDAEDLVDLLGSCKKYDIDDEFLLFGAADDCENKELAVLFHRACGAKEP